MLEKLLKKFMLQFGQNFFIKLMRFPAITKNINDKTFTYVLKDKGGIQC